MDSRIEYRPRLIWAIGAVAFGAIGPVLMALMWVQGRLQVRSSLGLGFWIALEVFMVVVFLVLVRIFVFGRFILGPEFVELRSGLSVRRARTSDATGFRQEELRNATTYMVYFRQHEKPIRIGSMFDLDHRFFTWLKSLPDLDKADLERSQAQLRESFGLPADSEGVSGRLAWRKWLARGLVFVAIGAGLVATSTPGLEVPALAVLMAIPAVALGVTVLDKGRFRIAWLRNDARVWLGDAIIVPCVMLLAMSLREGQILDARRLALWSAGIGVVLAGIAVALDKSLRAKPLQAVGFGALIVFGSVLTATTSNCSFDRTPPMCVDTRVSGKHESGESQGVKKVTLRMPDGSLPPADFRASDAVYEALQEGDPARLLVRRGLWRYAWVRLEAGSCGSQSAR